MANIVGAATITIARPAGEVWEYVVNPSNLHNWVKDVDSPGNWIDAGRPSVGSRYRIDYKYGRKTNEIIFEVTAATPGDRFSTNTIEGPYPISVDYTFREADNDGSIVAKSGSKYKRESKARGFQRSAVSHSFLVIEACLRIRFRSSTLMSRGCGLGMVSTRSPRTR